MFEAGLGRDGMFYAVLIVMYDAAFGCSMLRHASGKGENMRQWHEKEGVSRSNENEQLQIFSKSKLPCRALGGSFTNAPS